MPSLVLTRSRFLHVPKTGGNWIATVLRQLFPHFSRMQKIHTTLKAAPQPELFTFAFVRHPLTWYQSYFSYKQRKGWDPDNNWDERVRSPSFDEFLKKAFDETPGYYSKLLRRFVGPRDREIDFVGRFEHLTEDLIQALQSANEEFSLEQVRAVSPVNQSDYERFPARYVGGLRERLMENEAEAIDRFYAAGL